jgi:hypothetical protein
MCCAPRTFKRHKIGTLQNPSRRTRVYEVYCSTYGCGLVFRRFPHVRFGKHPTYLHPLTDLPADRAHFEARDGGELRGGEGGNSRHR